MIGRTAIQKDLILDTVNSFHNHAATDEIYRLVQTVQPHTRKGSACRNLNCLAEEGKIKEFEVPGGPGRFDHICMPQNAAAVFSCLNINSPNLFGIYGIMSLFKAWNGRMANRYHGA